MIQAPIFHVNGEDPEAAVYVAELALEFRQTFHRDVVIDLVCYRRHGHNEGDEPAFTQPVMYAQDQATGRALGEIYTEQLVADGDLTADEAEAIDDEFQDKLTEALRGGARAAPPRAGGMHGLRRPLEGADAAVLARPGRDGRAVRDAASGSPTRSTHGARRASRCNPKIDRMLAEPRQTTVHERQADRLGVRRGAGVRLAAAGGHAGAAQRPGQPPRHVQPAARRPATTATTGEPYVPLDAPRPEAGRRSTSTTACCREAAVLGFEYGYSLDDPNTLVLWEAQFGDFANGAQVIIDQFIACRRVEVAARQRRWSCCCRTATRARGRSTRSARLERFLQLCAEDNIQVCNPTTPAQYFHVLRRQMKRDFRKPLVLMTPKSLLRHKAGRLAGRASSPTGQFREVLDDAAADAGPRPPGGAVQRQGLLRPARAARRARTTGDVAHRPRSSSSTRGRRSS